MSMKSYTGLLLFFSGCSAAGQNVLVSENYSFTCKKAEQGQRTFSFQQTVAGICSIRNQFLQTIIFAKK